MKTKIDYSKKTDSELDNLMATNVRGWIRDNDYYVTADTDEIIIGVTEYSPTTDMNQAMECVDAISEDYMLELESSPQGNGEPTWYSALLRKGVVGDHSNDKNPVWVQDSSAPLAICKAIAKAKGLKCVR